MKSSIISRLASLWGSINLIIPAILISLICSCQKGNYEKTEKTTITLRVYEGVNPLGNSVKYYVHLYEGAIKWYPLIPVKSGKNEWGLEPGFEYVVSLRLHWLKTSELMEDGDTVEYEYLKVLSKIEVPLLTKDDILWDSIMW